MTSDGRSQNWSHKTKTKKSLKLGPFQQYAYNPGSICHMFDDNIDETGSLLLILDPFDATNPEQVN